MCVANVAIPVFFGALPPVVGVVLFLSISEQHTVERPIKREVLVLLETAVVVIVKKLEHGVPPEQILASNGGEVTETGPFPERLSSVELGVPGDVWRAFVFWERRHDNNKRSAFLEIIQ